MYIIVIEKKKTKNKKNQPIDLQYKSVDWFLYDSNLRHERVNRTLDTPLNVINTNIEQVTLIYPSRFQPVTLPKENQQVKFRYTDKQWQTVPTLPPAGTRHRK